MVRKYWCHESDSSSHQFREHSNSVVWENLGRLKTTWTAAFWISYSGQMAHAGTPARSELQQSRRDMTRAWTSGCVLLML